MAGRLVMAVNGSQMGDKRCMTVDSMAVDCMKMD